MKVIAETLKERLMTTFARLAIAAARKKVYSQKARQEDRPEVSHLLRTISESESVQARRLFNSLRGRIDISEEYVSTIFEDEIAATLEEYTQVLNDVKESGDRGMLQAIGQIRAAEKRIAGFFSKDSKDIRDKNIQKYFVCRFCGYINTEHAPDSCPICGAANSGFREVH